MHLDYASAAKYQLQVNRRVRNLFLHKYLVVFFLVGVSMISQSVTRVVEIEYRSFRSFKDILPPGEQRLRNLMGHGVPFCSSRSFASR